MAYPNRHELKAALRILLLNRGPVAASEAYAFLAEQFKLSRRERDQSLRDIDSSMGEENAWKNMVRWARRELKDAGELAISERGVWALNDAGRESAKIDRLIDEAKQHQGKQEGYLSNGRPLTVLQGKVLRYLEKNSPAGGELAEAIGESWERTRSCLAELEKRGLVVEVCFMLDAWHWCISDAGRDAISGKE